MNNKVNNSSEINPIHRKLKKIILSIVLIFSNNIVIFLVNFLNLNMRDHDFIKMFL